MDLDELKDQWQKRKTAMPVLTIEEQENNNMQMRQQMKQVDKTIRDRNIYGTLTFAIVLVALCCFAGLLYLQDAPMPVLAGVGVWLVTIAVNGYRLRGVRLNSSAAGPEGSTIEVLLERLTSVENEKRFYASILVTFFVPVGLGILLLLAGLAPGIIERGQNILLPITFIVIVYLLCCYAGTAYNRKYISTVLEPVQADLGASVSVLRDK
jgi:hypothetical protein